ncbi:MAG: hypothetical protein H7123_02510 [Thermoleophilia bacterium]|nr:hypothetical protein [Thermoleophilia bacterium]
MPSAAAIALDLLAHELRNAANIVVNGAQLLADQAGSDNDTEADTDIALDVELSGRQLAVLIDRLIIVARIEVNTAVKSADSVSVDQLCALAFRRVTRADRHALAIAPTPGCSDCVLDVHLGAAERALADAISMMGGPAGAQISCRHAAGWVHVSIDGASPTLAHPGVPGRLVLLRALAIAAGGKLEQAESGNVTLGFPGSLTADRADNATG